MAQVLQKSSNVGTAKMALKMKPQELWSLFNEVGFGTAPRSGFPGEVSGKLRAAKTWRPIEQATISYGHGISVSLLQLARAYYIFATDGELKPLALVKQQLPSESRQVISARTARQVRRMLELVVQPGGTATRARIPGYRVAGKTGTTNKIVGGSYAADRYISSFVGFAPASRPRLIVAVMVDEPTAGEHFGGVVAAPVFARVMAGGLRLLAVEHDAPLEDPAALTADAPVIKEDV